MRPERHWSGSSQKSSGFSLLELLLVVAILAVLFTLYWSPGSGSRQRALQNVCQRNLQKLYLSMNIFAADHAGKYPDVAGAKTSQEALEPLVPRYNSDTSIFICPASKDAAPPPGAPLREHRISYAYYMGRGPANAQQALLTDKQVDALAKSAGQSLFSSDGKPPGNNHGKSGGNLLLCDGQVQHSPPSAAVALPVNPGEVLLNP